MQESRWPPGACPGPAPPDGRKGKAWCAQPAQGAAVSATDLSPQAAQQAALGEPCHPLPCAESLHPHSQSPANLYELVS